GQTTPAPTTSFSLPTVATTLATTSTVPPTTIEKVAVPRLAGLRLAGAKAPPPPPPSTAPPPPPPTAPPARNCHDSYEGECLKVGIGDYDCAGGSGDGPNYVQGTVRVVGPDEFDLDRDGDGLGCEA